MIREEMHEAWIQATYEYALAWAMMEQEGAAVRS